MVACLTQTNVSLNLPFHFSNEEWEPFKQLKCQLFLQLTGNWSVAWPFSVVADTLMACSSDQRCPLHWFRYSWVGGVLGGGSRGACHFHQVMVVPLLQANGLLEGLLCVDMTSFDHMEFSWQGQSLFERKRQQSLFICQNRGLFQS